MVGLAPLLPSATTTATTAVNDVSKTNDNGDNKQSADIIAPMRRKYNDVERDEETEHYPRRSRAPYLHCDAADLGMLQQQSRGGGASSRHRGGDAATASNWTMDGASIHEGGDGGGCGDAAATAGSGGSAPPSPAMRRGSSFARMFSTLGMSPGPLASSSYAARAIAEDAAAAAEGGGEPPASLSSSSSAAAATTTGANNSHVAGGGADEGGGGRTQFQDSENTPRSLLPSRFWRPSTNDLANASSSSSMVTTSQYHHQQRRMSNEWGAGGGLVGVNATTTASTGRIPRWAYHDPSAVVMKDGQPTLVSALLHHHSLLARGVVGRRNDGGIGGGFGNDGAVVLPTWRLKERMKTVGACLVLALNIGTDPPDLHKPSPCARLQTWLDPTSISRAKARERIGERLEQQYARWQQRSRLRYRRALDPTVDAVRELCLRTRETARNERVLLHYNGHGVPRPTANGEIWLFDKHHTNYIPLGVADLRRWVGKPSIVVLDCSGAGVLLPFFAAALDGGGSNAAGNPESAGPGPGVADGGPEYLRAIRDTIVLCPTSQGEWLPLHPEFPADIFTSCLTTPMPIALRWFVRQNASLSARGLDLEGIADMIPGKLTDRKTPLGELNWIFTAITDTIAWNVLPSSLFQRLFRQDLLVASLFRNFLLADRILRSLNCTPASHPELPSTSHHPLWQSWDLAVETCLTQLIDAGLLKKGKSAPGGMGEATAVAASASADEEEAVESASAQQRSNGIVESVSSEGGRAGGVGADSGVGETTTTTTTTMEESSSSSSHQDVGAPFFAEQLTAFELWLEWASSKPRDKLVIRCPPNAVGGTPLPFLRGGQSAEDAERASYELDPPQELPIVLQVLLSPAHRVRTLVLLRRFFDLGPSAVNLALSVGIFPYVLKLLQSPIDEYKHVLIGIWSRVVKFDSSTQEDVVKDRALSHFIRHLSWGLPSFQSNPATSATTSSLEDASEQRTMAAFIMAVICSGYPLGQSECINEKLHITISSLLQSLESPNDSEREDAEKNISYQFRMWLIICLGNLSKDNASAQAEFYKVGLNFRLLERLDDDSPNVRTASCYALGCLIGSAPAKSIASEAATPLPSIFQQQSQPQLQRAPQALTPTFQQSRTLSGAMGTSIVNLSSSSQPLASTSTFMPTFNPPQLVSSLPGVPSPAQGGFNLVRGRQQPMMFGNILSTPAPPSRVSTQPEAKTVYEDEQRMNLDLSVAVKLAGATLDASPEVRFEAVLAVNRFIAKYIDAFVSIAGKTFGDQAQGRSIIGGSILLPFPEVGTYVEKKVTAIWAAVHRSDPFSTIRELLNSIVIAVNKRAVSEKTKLRHLRVSQRRRTMQGSIDEMGDDDNANDYPPSPLGGHKFTSGVCLPSYSPVRELKRTGSTGTSVGTPQAANASPTNFNWMDPTFPPRSMNRRNLETIPAPVEEHFCPESKFFCWQKVAFGNTVDSAPLDPLSDMGAMSRYRKTRNNLVKQKSHILKETFAVLAERPVRMNRSPYDYDESDAAAGLEKEADLKKEALQLEQVSLLRNSSGRSTSLLLFHPYEPALVVCGGSDNISVWDTETSERMFSFSNSSNPKSTRMSSALWINESSTSLLLTGTNDGTVRIHDGLFEPNDDISREKPSVISSFVAAPDIVSDKRYSSGLVLEFQQCGGQLIAGGNTKIIRCWDVSTGKCRNSFDSKSDASLTALTTAWDYDYTSGYSGIGPDIIVAGYGNGSLRVFDTRSDKGDPVQLLSDGLHHNSLASRRRKFNEFDEHTSWIVDVSFATYSGRHEIVSGCVAGSIKFWDLRYSSSVRTIDHKMQMTALSAHSTIPMFATGSPAQFIKIMSHDGMTQQVIRYHEKISGQRIGPVSCLSFHPHTPLLAAGFADDIVSLYAPKKHSPA